LTSPRTTAVSQRQSTIKSAIRIGNLESESAVGDRQSAIGNRQSAVNQQSEIDNQQFHVSLSTNVH
jgi:hypothetical protein